MAARRSRALTGASSVCVHLGMERLHREGAGRRVDRGTAEGGRGAACGAARRRGAAMHWRYTFQTDPVQARFSPKNCIKVHKAMNRKLVDLTTLYNFHKGRLVFFSTDFVGTSAKH
jgi:hypothetical protein